MNRNFSAGAAIMLVLGLILVFATSGNTITLGSFAVSPVTVGWILTIVGAVLRRHPVSRVPGRPGWRGRRIAPGPLRSW